MTAHESEHGGLRGHAIERLNKKRELRGHMLAYVLVNSLLVVIWAMTSRGFFWPVFPLFGWGIGLVMHVWDVYSDRPSEEAIRREMDRIAREGGERLGIRT